jgi:eukaryotic-like serine/threonine-protein kinase
MDSLLHAGMTVTTHEGHTAKVDKCLGSGGQGEVWKVEYRGKPAALKLYYPKWLEGDTGLLTRLERLVKKGPPASTFVWPEDIVVLPDQQTCGYFMPIIDMNACLSLRELDSRRVTPTFSDLCTIGYEIAEAFWQLHTKGLSYRDISKDNVLFNPKTLEIKIVDNDNIDVSGSDAAIGGTFEFMAPELVRGDPGANANRRTDLHSLSVLLFYLFHIHHPLEGKRKLAIRCWDISAKREMYGRKPVFIFDQNDRSNEALKKDPRTDPTGEAGNNAVEFWNVYPSAIHNLFMQAFTEGLSDPSKRISVADWRDRLIRVRDTIVYCPGCGEQNFTEDNSNVVGDKCWNQKCQSRVPLPFRLTVSDKNIYLNSSTKLYPHHVEPRQSFNFASAVATMVQHPTLPDIWGLQNISSTKWTANPPDAPPVDIPPGKSVALQNGTRINFGTSEGEITQKAG